MKSENTDIWKSQVRDYEVDFQGIVNNANYFHYFDEARSKFLYKKGINLKEYADNGLNLILVSTTISFKAPLKFSDQFIVKSTFSQSSKIRFACNQSISLLKNELEIECVVANSTLCAIQNSKPIHLKALSALFV
ncbi:MAG: acyl-CoA thioesterase [Legionellales bacterium]|nr:acyl-CoA thioesterase [Legionellales bacterium]